MAHEHGSPALKALEVGDRVNWMYCARGGYGYITPVAAVILKIGPKRVQVRVAQRIAGTWHTKTVWVEADSLKPRVSQVPEVDEDPNAKPSEDDAMTPTIHVVKIPEGFVCKGEIWASANELTDWNSRFWPVATFEIKTADASTCAFWQAALKNGTAKIRGNNHHNQ